jgi:hypothetical protein
VCLHIWLLARRTNANTSLEWRYHVLQWFVLSPRGFAWSACNYGRRSRKLWMAYQSTTWTSRWHLLLVDQLVCHTSFPFLVPYHVCCFFTSPAVVVRRYVITWRQIEVVSLQQKCHFVNDLPYLTGH